MNILDRKYTWSFVGHAAGKPTRETMLSELKSVPGPSFQHLTTKWDDPLSLPPDKYSSVLKNSIFAPCPRGNFNLESFRIYEALEAGCIPIIEAYAAGAEGDDYFKNLFGDHPLIESPPDWLGVGKDLSLLLGDPQFLVSHQKKVSNWWRLHKLDVKKRISSILVSPNKAISPSIDPVSFPAQKHKEFISLKEEWVKFKDYSFLEFASSSIPIAPVGGEVFSCYNPGCDIGIVSLYTPEISHYAIESEINIREYCVRQGYTFYVYRDSLDKKSHGNWSKPQALLNHINDHQELIWMDSDTLIFNPEKRFEDILSRAVPMKQIIACEDIGANNTTLAKGSEFNSGVVIFRNHPYVHNILKRWWDFRENHDTSSLYASGGDQEVLIDILKKNDPFGYNRKIFPMNTFNTDPRLVDKDTFILHFMAYPAHLKHFFMNFFNKC